MKKSWLLGIVTVIFIGAFCLWILRPGDTTETYSTVARDKPKLPANLSLTKIRQQGNVTIAQLQSPVQIDGFPCAASWVHFAESGQLQAFYLGETVIIGGNEIPKGTWIRLNPDLTLRFCSLPADTNIQGYLCRGGFGGSEGVTTGFYPRGRLQSFFPPKDVEIQGIPCRATPFGPVFLYENGNLKQLTLARDIVIEGRSFDEGQTVVLGERGEVQSVSNPPMIERARNWSKKLFR